ncbi:MAG TPA: NAD(P)-binding protein [Sporichthyaceae bacterium]|jgi:glycine/D-amino acid oxidase-like deaminating enzyme|nr:NAD(P)-binding protein [Sporichthyaceae bacterium]
MSQQTHGAGTSFDAIVVGGGAAGVCCAAELVRLGAKPLLVSESKEVGYLFRSLMIGEDTRAVVHHPTRNLHGSGGYWYTLCRQLDVPVKAHSNFTGLAFTVEGSGLVKDLSMCPSAAALTDVIATLSPVPLGDSRGNLQKALHAGLAMSPQELAGLHHVGLVEWLHGIGTDELTTGVLLSLGAALTYLEIAQAVEHLSVFGLFGPLRGYLCGEAHLCTIEPDAREGLLIPLAREIENRGGTVWRGGRVAEVIVQGGSAVGVVMQDGTEARAPMVALATGTRRIGSLLNPVPPEVERVSVFEGKLGDLGEYTTYAVTEGLSDAHPGRVIVTVRADGSQAQVDWNLSSVAPWCSGPGQQVIGSEVIRSRSQVEALGGEPVLHAEMQAVTENIYPGFRDSIVDFGSMQHPLLVTTFLTGPKLPRRSDSIEGLWFVGEESTPVDGIYTEGAASAGVLGARAMRDTVQ